LNENYDYAVSAKAIRVIIS